MSNPYREPNNPVEQYEPKLAQFIDVEVKDVKATFHFTYDPYPGEDIQVKEFIAKPEGYWANDREDKVIVGENARNNANEYSNESMKNGVFHFDQVSLPAEKLIKITYESTTRMAQIKMY